MPTTLPQRTRTSSTRSSHVAAREVPGDGRSGCASARSGIDRLTSAYLSPATAPQQRLATRAAVFAGERFVEVEGDAEAAPAIEGPRDLLTLAIPVATMVMLAGFLVGVDARIITAGALALAIAWRLADGAEPDLRRFRTYLAIAAAAALFVFLATALIYFFASALGATEGIGIYAWQLLARLYPVLLVVAMAGIWVFGGRLSGDAVGRRWWWALAVGLVALGALIPVAACVLRDRDRGSRLPRRREGVGAGDQRARGRAQGSARGEQAQRVSERQALPSIAIRPGQKLPFCWAFACRLCPVGWRRCSSFGWWRC